MRQAINPMPLEDAEYQHTYLVPTQEITFNQAILKNTHWSGTCLNAKSKITGQVGMVLGKALNTISPV
jgi:hypothetical protein